MFATVFTGNFKFDRYINFVKNLIDHIVWQFLIIYILRPMIGICPCQRKKIKVSKNKTNRSENLISLGQYETVQTTENEGSFKLSEQGGRDTLLNL